MRLRDIFSPDSVVFALPGQNKEVLLEELSKRAAATLAIDPGIAEAQIKHREAIGSTGIGAGVAVPHARIDKVVRPFGILASLSKAIDFDAVDGRPVDLIVLLLLSTSAPGEQLAALASVTRRLRNETIQNQLRQAADGASLYDVFCRGS